MPSQQLVTIPCLSDNYAFLLHNTVTGETTLIDAPEAAPINATLAEREWSLTTVMLTHHHYDHIDGLPDILAQYPNAKVIGASADAHRLPALDVAVAEGDTLTIAGESVRVIDVPGHTVGHIAYYFPDTKAVFTGDSLMALGCGRLFEGTPDMMWQSLSKLAALPDGTTVCSGHEYTVANGRFAATIDTGNPALNTRLAAVAKARADGIPTVPSSLAEERATNPFLRPNDPAIQRLLGMEGADPASVFAEIRRRKDNF
ncbi:hydroxyacylglutathione hydrolase [Shimia abyssi]|uniref:Hydroxyacylglutathione hydrolase n=1 Tax=Shimia abyssi TaxID=1662395 RepID=A0A2P8F7J3_9RHOB|nr:hydroxyacylglutathione hydrolase [Shimia abyssi]PSL17684.1 hydroxyacylglutathione hydrolase [Shimia abyssi]